MTMFVGYGHHSKLVKKSTMWKMEPHDELVDNGNCCLAKPGETYAVYLPSGGKVTVKLEPGRYQASWFDPRSGKFSALPEAHGPEWTSPPAPDSGDWALLLTRVKGVH